MNTRDFSGVIFGPFYSSINHSCLFVSIRGSPPGAHGSVTIRVHPWFLTAGKGALGLWPAHWCFYHEDMKDMKTG
jgi:hypothetical protein